MEPEVGVLPDVAGVVAGVERADVVDDGEQDVLVVPWQGLVAVGGLQLGVAAVRDEGGHVEHLGKVDAGRDLFVQPRRAGTAVGGRMFETENIFFISNKNLVKKICQTFLLRKLTFTV